MFIVIREKPNGSAPRRPVFHCPGDDRALVHPVRSIPAFRPAAPGDLTRHDLEPRSPSARLLPRRGRCSHRPDPIHLVRPCVIFRPAVPVLFFRKWNSGQGKLCFRNDLRTGFPVLFYDNLDLGQGKKWIYRVPGRHSPVLLSESKQ